jgi:hypothetical protein
MEQQKDADKYPRAFVDEIDGELVLHDPDAVAIIKAVAKNNCINTRNLNADRIEHFKQRITERNLTSAQVVIIIINVDDVNGGPIADVIMPDTDWQEIRDRGEVPFARGLVMRDGIQKMLKLFDGTAAHKLQDTKGTAVVVIDHGVAEIFSA